MSWLISKGVQEFSLIVKEYVGVIVLNFTLLRLEKIKAVPTIETAFWLVSDESKDTNSLPHRECFSLNS